MPPKTSTPPKAGFERSTFFFKYIKCSFYRNLTESLSVQIHNEKQGYNAEKRRGEKEEKKAQKSSMEETGRCYLDQLPPPPKPNPRPTGKPTRLPPLIQVYCAGFTSLLYFLPSLSTFPSLLFKACCTFLH